MVLRDYLLLGAVCLWSVFGKLTAKAAFLGLARVSPYFGGALTHEWSCRLRISASTALYGDG
jgi:hypothetical protein